MGCACKTNQQISYLQRKYGTNQPQSKATNIRSNLSIGIKNFLLILLVIPLVPIVGLFLIIRQIFVKKPIDVNKTFKIKS